MMFIFLYVNAVTHVMELSCRPFSVINLSHGVVIRRSVAGGEESPTEETGWDSLFDG